MKRIIIFVCVFSALIITFNLTVTGQDINQNNSGDNCEGPIYKAGEVTKRAVLASRPRFSLTDEARANGLSGVVKLKVVLCRSGQVTDIQVIEGLPFGVTEQAVEAVRKINFTPAEIAGQIVSQEIKIEYSFSYLGDSRPLATGKLEGRVISSTQVDGYSQVMSHEVQKCISLLGGQVYNKELVEKVWQCLLKLEDFDRKTSRLRIEESNRGGLGVVFLLQKKHEKKLKEF